VNVLGDLPVLPAARCRDLDHLPAFDIASDAAYQVLHSNRGNPARAAEAGVPAALICHTCPERLECLRWAVEQRETGVWGGAVLIAGVSAEKYRRRNVEAAA
jgi:hypothetical protein